MNAQTDPNSLDALAPTEPRHNEALAGAAAQADLVVRQHERVLCELAASVAVSPASLVAVRLARGVGTGTGDFNAVIVDCSIGGLGLNSTVFLPRGSAVTVRINPPGGSGEASPIDFPGIVQRVTMLSRDPTYYLGVSFAADPRERAAATDVLITLAHQSGKHAEVTRGRA